MRKVLSIIFFLFLIIICFEAVYYIHLSGESQKLNQVNNKLNIIYKSRNDKDGNTLLYDNPNYGWTGIGLNTKGPWTYISGIFNSWINIDKTNDKYINIIDPFTNKDLYKVRIIHPTSYLITQDTSIQPTRLMIEHLNNYLIKDKSEMSVIGQALSEKKEIKDILPKKGDSIVIFFPPNKNSHDDIPKDENGYYIAYYITIRRYE